jgi:hypothetical protein
MVALTNSWVLGGIGLFAWLSSSAVMTPIMRTDQFRHAGGYLLGCQVRRQQLTSHPHFYYFFIP